jgi:hypothetical protein
VTGQWRSRNKRPYANRHSNERLVDFFCGARWLILTLMAGELPRILSRDLPHPTPVSSVGTSASTRSASRALGTAALVRYAMSHQPKCRLTSKSSIRVPR